MSLPTTLLTILLLLSLLSTSSSDLLGIKKLIIGLIIGGVVGFWIGMNMGKGQPLLAYPFSGQDVKQTAKEAIKDTKRAVREQLKEE